MSVTVLVPTFRRPDGLARALRSLFAQTVRPDQIVVVDNAPEGGARSVTEALASASPVAIEYVHEPRAGVANARNAGFEAARGRFIVQLDDDESAAAHWLESLLIARDRLNAAVVFGPVRAQAPSSTGSHASVRNAYISRLYSRTGPDVDQVLTRPRGCGNSLIDRREVSLPEPPFDPVANETGGEDDILFAALSRDGVRFGWAAGAEVIEHVEPRRANWRHLLLRSFAYGQGPSQNCFRRAQPDWPGLAAWMGIGAAQLVVYGLCALPARLISARACAACLDRTAKGAGKLVWMERFEPRFYGASHA